MEKKPLEQPITKFTLAILVGQVLGRWAIRQTDTHVKVSGNIHINHEKEEGVSHTHSHTHAPELPNLLLY